MSITLFVNACMRKEESRTLILCREYLASKDTVVEVDLTKNTLKPFDAQMLKDRLDLQEAAAWDDPLFDLARQCAEADEIVIGAPYWDLSFPSALKVYIEHTTVNGIVFRYTEEGEYAGMCKAKRIILVSGCGGWVEGANYGYEYLCGIARMYGIAEVHQVVAESLDVIGSDIEAQMDKARVALAALKERQG